MCYGSVDDFIEEVTFEKGLERYVHWVVKGGETFQVGAETQIVGEQSHLPTKSVFW